VRTSSLRRLGVNHTVLPANAPHLPLLRSSPEGATTEWTVIAPADEAYYSSIDPLRMNGLVGLDLQRTVYPHKWLSISCRSSAGQWKFAGQGLTFYHWATQPTPKYTVVAHNLELLVYYIKHICDKFKAKAAICAVILSQANKTNKPSIHVVFSHTVVWLSISPVIT